MALPGKLRFDTEDFAPSSYYERSSRSPPTHSMRIPFQTPKPEGKLVSYNEKDQI